MIKRKLFYRLKEHLNKPEITFIVGPRQVGKTTLMLKLKDEIEKNGETTVYMNLDMEKDKIFFKSQQSLLQKIKLELGNKKGFVFIDEIQRKENAGVFLKGLYDMRLPYKFIVSGSGSVELKENIKESLFGRKRIFELYPVSFEEFVNYKTAYKYEDRLIEFFKLEKEKTSLLLDEYLKFGGYPRVIIEDQQAEKLKLLNEIYQSFIEKDIIYLLNVKKSESFSELIKILAAQIGQIVNYTEISSTLGIAFVTLKEYLWYLEKTYIVNKLTPYFTNVRKELSKAPIYYFNDLGLRNFSLMNFVSENRSGFLFQNFIYNVLKEKLFETPVKINFWRTKDKSEVDFVINSGKELLPVEIKFSKIKKPKINVSLRNFIKKYKPQRAYIINLELEQKIKTDKTEVIFLPYWKIIFENLF